MVFGADDFGAWLVAILADAGRKRLTTVVLGSDQERALRGAAKVAVQLTASELRPDGGGAEELAMVVSEVFTTSAPGFPTTGRATLLEALQTGIATQLAALDDVELTGTQKSSAQVLGFSAGMLAEKLTQKLIREVMVRGARGGPLAPLAAQLNADKTNLQGQRIEDIVGRLDNAVREALDRLDARREMSAAQAAPAQLPAVTTGFTGREAEIAGLIGLLDPAAALGLATVSALAGMAGVGKTTLAVEAGHAARERGWFPGGVLFTDLHGYDNQRMEPRHVLESLLRALRILPQDIPSGVEERAGLYRSTLADMPEPVLLIFDNATSEAQVRPLIPGAGPHRVIVTSRHKLVGLEARLLSVRELDDIASVKLLDIAVRLARPEDDRVSSSQDAAARLAGLCGGLPLALQIVAAMLKADAAYTVTEMADELAAEHDRLEQLQYDDGSSGGGFSVAAAFELSYRHLDEESAYVFRLLPVNPGPHTSTAALSVLTDLPSR